MYENLLDEIFYVLKGEVIVMGYEEKITANEGETFVIYPLEKHSLYFNKRPRMHTNKNPRMFAKKLA